MTCDEALFIVPKDFFQENRGTMRCMFQYVDLNIVNIQLGSAIKHGKSSIFSRNNYTDEDNNPIEENTHAFRHYLTYIAKRKSVDGLVIALWAGRKRIDDNRAYGNLSTAEKTTILIEHASDIAGDLDLIGVDVNDPECLSMFHDVRQILELAHQYVHETRFGYCIHEYDVEPCKRRGQCLDCCDKHKCFKGQKEKEARIREEYERAAVDLESLERAIADGKHEDGSKLHMFAIKRKAIRKQYVAIFDDPEHPDGTCIQATKGLSPSQLEIAINHRISLGGEEGKLLASTARQATLPMRGLLPSLTKTTVE